MGKKSYSLWLYCKHDMDILSLLQRNVNLTKVLYVCLKSFYNKEIFVLDLPPRCEMEWHGDRRIQRKLTLDEEKDADIISMIEKIDKGGRNNFFKQVIRLYLSRPVDDRCIHGEEDQAFFEERMSVFTRKKRMVKAGWKKNKKAGKKKDSKKTVLEKPIKKEPPAPVSQPVIEQVKTDPMDIPVPVISESEIPIPPVQPVQPPEKKEDLFPEIPVFTTEKKAEETVSEEEQDELNDLFSSIFGA